MEKRLITIKLSDIVPYEKNPRKNKKAVKVVKESIQQVGYNNPIIVDENNVILCGHTRRLSLMEIGEDEVQVLQILGLNDRTKRKFRLLDNKVGEFSSWDYVALTQELAGLDFRGMELDWGLDWSMDEGEEGEKERKTKEKPEYVCPECGFHFKA